MNNSKHNLIIVLLLFLSNVYGQNNNVGINTNTPDPSAILHLEANDKGLLMPRLTEVERNAIVAPAEGLVIYNVDLQHEEIYNGTCWVPSYIEDCDECLLDISFQNTSYTIDRVNSLSLTIPVTITQGSISGQTLDVALSMVHSFSDESDVSLSANTVTGSGTVDINITTNVFEDGGDHYITLFGFCQGTVVSATALIQVQACDQVIITADQTDYDLTSSGVSGSNCVVVTIEDNVGIRGSDVATPAFTTGGLNSNCNIGIINKGYVFGKGADGPALMGQNGITGGNAFEIGCNAEFRNTGMIYGGGGSGLTVGALEPVDLGIMTICFAIGAGGGAGIPDGLGGGSTQGNCTTTIGFWEFGNDAGHFYDDNEGFAISETLTQDFNAGPINGVIVITANGGAGGDFGEDGTAPTQPVDFTGSELNICINVPFIGNVCAPVPGFSSALNSMANSINNSVNNSVPGEGGYAVKYTGTVSLPDGDYQTITIRGEIGN